MENKDQNTDIEIMEGSGFEDFLVNNIEKIAIISVATVIGSIVGHEVKLSLDFKKAKKTYESIHDDVIPFDELKRKSYKLTGLHNSKGNVRKSFMKYLKMANSFIEFSDNNKPIFGVAYTKDISIGYDVITTTRKVYLAAIDSGMRKHADYYFACACYDLKLKTRELKQWIKECKDLNTDSKIITKESVSHDVNSIKLDIFESWHDGYITEKERDMLLNVVE